MSCLRSIKVACVLGMMAVPATLADETSCSTARPDLCTVDTEEDSDEVSLLAHRGKLHGHRLNTKPTKCMHVIHSTYDSSKKMSVPEGDREFAFEPFRLLGDDEWADMKMKYDGGWLTPSNTDMTWHNNRMIEMYELVLVMFEKTLPHVKWILDAGGLLGAWVTGHLYPWDNDIDITVSNITFNTQDTEQKLMDAYPQIGTSRGNYCEEDGCRMFEVSDDVVLVVHSLPTNETDVGIIAKFICRFTGLYIDINADYETEEVEEKAWANGLRFFAPKKPSTRTYLERFDDLPDIKYWFNFSDVSELYECTCPSDDFEELNTADTTWELQVVQPCAESANAAAPWHVAKVDQRADCCRQVAADYRPGIVITPRWE